MYDVVIAMAQLDDDDASRCREKERRCCRCARMSVCVTATSRVSCVNVSATEQLLTLCANCLQGRRGTLPDTFAIIPGVSPPPRFPRTFTYLSSRTNQVSCCRKTRVSQKKTANPFPINVEKSSYRSILSLRKILFELKIPLKLVLFPTLLHSHGSKAHARRNHIIVPV